jgi:hypothetical protein
LDNEEVKNIESETPAPAEAEAQVVRTLNYFAEDGNYGNADGLTIMETTHWDDTDWAIIESASEWARPEVARVLTESYEPGADEAALRAKLDALGVDLTDYEK